MSGDEVTPGRVAPLDLLPKEDHTATSKQKAAPDSLGILRLTADLVNMQNNEKNDGAGGGLELTRKVRDDDNAIQAGIASSACRAGCCGHLTSPVRKSWMETAVLPLQHPVSLTCAP